MDSIFNNPDFYPTPDSIIREMLYTVELRDKIVLEPSAGKGNIIDQLWYRNVSQVLTCEVHPDLREIKPDSRGFP